MSNRQQFQAKRFLSHLQRLKRDDNGAAAVAMAVLSPILIGGMGIGAETGYWYYTQRKLQHAADVAVHAAGTRKRVGGKELELRNAALQTAQTSGFKPLYASSTSNGPTTLVNLIVNDPPTSGTRAGRPDSVEVKLFETHPRMLSSIFSKEPVQIGARAVARIMGGNTACVLALSETSSRAVEVSGSSSATLNGCSVAANSVSPEAYYMPNSKAFLSADCIYTVGGAAISRPSPDLLVLKTCSSVQEQAPKTLDPYAAVPEPQPDPSINTCVSGNNVSGTVKPDGNGIRCFNGLSLGTATLEKGLYIINGGELKVNDNSVVSGQGVTFFLANNATVSLLGNAKLTLSAPTPENAIEATKPYIGLLFFGARCNPILDQQACQEKSSILGKSDSSLQGAVYLPGSTIEFLGDSNAANRCLQIIADKVIFTGDATLNMGVDCNTAGTKPILVSRLVKIVE